MSEPAWEYLDRSDDEAHRALRALVAKENFEPEAVPADLTVFQMFGRWFATYTDPHAPAELPERERRELLAIQVDPGRPGQIHYVEL